MFSLFFMRQLKIKRSLTHTDENIQRYLNEIDKVDLINVEEEVILAQKIKQ